MDPDCDYLTCSSQKNKTHENIKEHNIRETTEETDQVLETDHDCLPIETHQTVEGNNNNRKPTPTSPTWNPPHQYLTLIKGIKLYISNYNI